jgi:hypothetical protein
MLSNKTKRNAAVACLGALALFAIVTSDPSAVMSSSTTRLLSTEDIAKPLCDTDNRRLAYAAVDGQCETEVSFENFEGSDALTGWTNGNIEDGAQTAFSTFLGRYGLGSPNPSKTYSVNANADVVLVEIDFYEIDSWDGGTENASIFINDEEVDLGNFQWRIADDQKIGTTPKGIQFICTKLVDPMHLGFHDRWKDETHHISLVIPKSSGLYVNGYITMKMVVNLNEAIENESAGWDNIEVSYVSQCPSPAATPAPNSESAAPKSISGVNGDPLIMGLKGQLFKFDGRSGGWYSAISTPSFQWNMKISQFADCPAKSDTFCSGAGFTFFDSKKQKTQTVEVNVVNEHSVNVGCGGNNTNCLGAGSLEIILDGTKMTAGGDYKFKDGTGRILAYNTFYQCARKWYDFEEVDVPGLKQEKTSLRQDRSLAVALKNPGVFDVMDDLKDTMIDEAVCEKWIGERKKLGDLFQQGGRYSTIIIQTETVTFHVEYKQENERCNAHSINVWMSSVSPNLWSEPWEGVIGETKDGAVEKKDIYSRDEVLKFANDEDYEVKSPFATKCKGCVN